ncbi:MAG: hypothetical protein ACRD09_14190 [Vicinamibacterales bacterium]
MARAARGTGAGRAALDALVAAARDAGFWKLVSRVFPENTAVSPFSIARVFVRSGATTSTRSWMVSGAMSSLAHFNAPSAPTIEENELEPGWRNWQTHGT